MEERDLLQEMGNALQMFGMDPYFAESEDFPLAVETKILGYEDTDVLLNIMMPPMGSIIEEDVKVLQFYISLFDQNMKPEQFIDVERFCNWVNAQTAVGSFGVQEYSRRLYYKQTIVLGNEKDLQVAATTGIDQLMVFIF